MLAKGLLKIVISYILLLTIGDLSSVPEDLGPYYQHLISPIHKSVIGDGICGLPSPDAPPPILDGREAIDALVTARRIDLIENALVGYNPGGRVYAVIELLKM